MAAGGFTAPDYGDRRRRWTYNYAIGPADFALLITPSDATPLSTTGGTVSQTEQTNTQPATQSDVPLLNQFYFDTTKHDQTVGMPIPWNHRCQARCSTAMLDFVSSFTNYGSAIRRGRRFAGCCGS